MQHTPVALRRRPIRRQQRLGRPSSDRHLTTRGLQFLALAVAPMFLCLPAGQCATPPSPYSGVHCERRLTRIGALADRFAVRIVAAAIERTAG